MTTDLPNPPWRVLATALMSRDPQWWYISPTGDHAVTMRDAAREFRNIHPIDHPRNDPEAVEIIRRAKEPK